MKIVSPIRLALIVAAALAAGACGKLVGEGTDSSTHWLSTCDSDSECGPLSCLCGVCTRPCSDVSVCPESGTAQCAASDVAGCGLRDSVCRVACSSDEECSAVRPGLSCVSGQCRGSRIEPGAGGAGGSSGGAGSAGAAGGGGEDCSSIAQCELPCPEGSVNPVDENGCEHTCECVEPGTPPGSLRMFFTCGDPVCSGHTPQTDVAACGTEQAGDVCRVQGARCDPGDDCNSLLLCASSDPRMVPGGCPISRRSYKTDIRYLEADELRRYQAELLQLKLATWRYKHDPEKQRLGFMIDDHEESFASDSTRDQVDLYSYASLAVAALQVQSRQIEDLEQQVRALTARLDAASPPDALGETRECTP